ncbi:MAG: aminoacyl-tRNA hydrolase [Spirochaetaceae bacterium]|nr:aminoacyl-tRNA hydrolase [Spirochaetaceae bacterium]
MHIPEKIELAVFLGNPGTQYSQTRHNMARMLLETLPGVKELIWREKFHGKFADYAVDGSRCRLLVPETFMNKSGVSVSAAVKFFKIDLKSLLVIHDDLELPFGQYSCRAGGGMAGHNGLKSLRDSLGKTEFIRLRLGIGRPKHGSVQSWVLGRFSPDEEAVLSLILNHASESLYKVISGMESIQTHSEPVMVYPAN